MRSLLPWPLAPYRASPGRADRSFGRDQSQMLLWMSRFEIGHSGGDLQGRVDCTNHVVFETTDDLGLAHPLPGSAMHVLPGSEVMAKADQNDAIESGIGLPVATPVQPVPVGLAGGGRYWTHPAQRGEGSLGVNGPSIPASMCKQGKSRMISDIF